MLKILFDNLIIWYSDTIKLVHLYYAKCILYSTGDLQNSPETYLQTENAQDHFTANR